MSTNSIVSKDEFLDYDECLVDFSGSARRLNLDFGFRKSDPASIRPHLDAIERIAAGDPAAGPMARLGQAERFHWLVSPSSTIIQPSAVHSGLCDDPATELAHLVATLVE